MQDCDYLINYDIHWNPVRIIQRFGRIDRIGSRNDHIQLVNFWPDMDLDEYINLKSRVETRMKISVMTSTGDDDLINSEEKGDLEYRRAQLKRLQEEVVDIEDMTSGISIMDLGLNEFRLDLLEYMKQHEDIETAPKGLHTVVGQTEDSPAGVIFVLRNINDSVNIAIGTAFTPSTWSTSAKEAKLSAITSTQRNCSTRCVCSAVARASLVRSFVSDSMMRRMTDAKWAKSLSY